MKTRRSHGQITQIPATAGPGTALPGQAGDASALPHPPQLVRRKSAPEQAPRPRSRRVPPSLLETAPNPVLDLPAQRRRAEVAKLAGEVERCAERLQKQQQQMAGHTQELQAVQQRLARAERQAAGPDDAAVQDLRGQMFRLEWRHRQLGEELASAEARLQQAQQRLAAAGRDVTIAWPQEPSTQASRVMTPATPRTPVTPTGVTHPGISPTELRTALERALATGLAPSDTPLTAGPEVPPALRTRIEALIGASHAAEAAAVPLREQVPATAAVSTGAVPAALSDPELRLLRSALPHEGAAVTRLARRARLQQPRSLADRVRAQVQHAPRPLEGQLFERFMGMLLDDIAAIARKSGRPPLQAAALMQRAVDTGALGASLPPQERHRLSLALHGATARLASGRPPPDKQARRPDPWAIPTSPTLGELFAQDPPAKAKAPPDGVAINQLNSGLKVDLARQPDAAIASLQPRELGALLQALQLGPPDTDERGLYDQKLRAQALLNGFCDKLGDWGLQPHGLYGPTAGLLKRRLPGEAREKLLAAAEVAHCHLQVSRSSDDDPPRMRLEIFFGAMEPSTRDVQQAFKTATGGLGPVYKATDAIAEVLAAQIHAMNGRVEIGFVGGASMGGGTAQAFLAGLESRVRLSASPPLILLDPQLLNNAQSRHATRSRPLDYDFEKPRGVAISLDYDKAPHRGLMGIMKGPGGYTYPGLLHLKLGLKDDDGPAGGKPLAVPPGLGYHGVGTQFVKAIRRFTGRLGEPPPPSLREPPGRHDEGAGSGASSPGSLQDWESGDSASLASASMRSDRSGPSGL